MPTIPRSTRKSTSSLKAKMTTRREFVADLLDVCAADVVELPAATDCLPILSVGGYLYVVELPTDAKEAVEATLARLGDMERLVSDEHPGVGLYSEMPEGVEGEADLALQALRCLTEATEVGAFDGTKSATLAFARAHRARYSQRQDLMEFEDGSALAFGSTPDGTFGVLIHYCPEGTMFPIAPGTRH